MGYTPKRGHGPQFRELGSSPALDGVDLTKKTGLGPRADNKEKIRVSDKNEAGGYVSEDELESKFKKKGSDEKNYPQLSVQDYSKVKEDDMGKYVEHDDANEPSAPGFASMDADSYIKGQMLRKKKE